MKNTILILISLLFVTGVSEGKEVSYLQDRNGIKYEVNAETPFSGKYVTYYENGQREVEVNYKYGKKDGLDTLWFENGQKLVEENYRNGKEEGLHTQWFGNGQKRMEWDFKNGKREGLWIYWDKEGNVTETETYKDGELVK